MKLYETLPRSRTRQGGMTRTDAAALLAVLFLLGGILLPVLTAANSKSQLEQCRTHLRLIGQGFAAWMEDHGNRPPWRIVLAEGGTYDLPGNGNAWVHLAWLSNHIASPKILACPADQVRVAEAWTRDPEGGFLHPNYRGNAISYFVGLDIQEGAAKSLLGGDSYLHVSGKAQACDYANVKVAASLKPDDKSVGWTEGQHGDPGNILFYDGRVSPLQSEQLRQALPETGAVHKDNHILLPR